ncbi:MAG: DNA mismatch repair protein MutS [candidate division KSB1 bacterium]|nr:DNA mismatch repair protein MutS [candidate division KSB1 bacterium]MDZ7275474.1 DNA mismatch repair protein MutS [candidate division KSB1 bacterium]MDZ7286214.1 DNA mismatch repair protein MutS [candidate division KSB1 bacterium]MDZ7296440.1 DNA mismatch repair protein MutS [candidate division KSB1 bacterium]MDZ7307236.1 DNA mismatch repair protein MutS [candidate division KSB1 bacterium]
MRQYLAIKAQHQDAILFFRMGDFYEMFFEDAKIASQVLGLTLTSRAHGKAAEVPLAGFPHHALDTYLSKMVRAGYRVAICEQVENPKLAKIVVKREVTEVVTPGTALSDNLLTSRRNNFLLALYLQKKTAGLAQIDFSTGEFMLDELPLERVGEVIQDIEPAEILLPEDQQDWLRERLGRNVPAVITPRPAWHFAFDHAYESLTRHFKTLTLKGFGCDDLICGISAAGGALSYLQETQKTELTHLTQLARRSNSEFVGIDPATRRNLELVRALRGDNQHATLLGVLDQTRTAMGGRKMVQWLLHPLRQEAAIRARQDAVAELLADGARRDKLAARLRGIGDLERLVAKISLARANARELLTVQQVQERIPELKSLLLQCESALLQQCGQALDPLQELTGELRRALVEDPPLSVTEGNLIRPGYSAELDELRQLARHGKDWIANLQKTERERTGIASLKVGYTKVFGYYLEVTNPNLAKVPDSYIRKQTLANAERFITPELKEYEERILQAEEKLVALEYELFDKLRQKVAAHAAALQENGRALATVDCLLAFAEVAQQQNYVRPLVDDSSVLEIKQGRHPVVEKLLPFGEKFVPNDTYLDDETHQILIITGPNMAGKSTYLRQVALIVLMAQIGSFVPAAQARIGMVDKIFTRVGASDNLAGGESTFLVEMNETANILNNATNRSLVLLDEIGRGTSTYDGLSIAWAVVEYLHENAKIAARTLFATHYHELIELERLFPRVKNYNVLVKEWGEQVVFLRRIVAGGCDHSYGIHVAQLAGLPAKVIRRAKQVLATLEQQTFERARLSTNGEPAAAGEVQLDIFSQQDQRVRAALLKLDLNHLTPLEALQQLAHLQKLATE